MGHVQYSTTLKTMVSSIVYMVIIMELLMVYSVDGRGQRSSNCTVLGLKNCWGTRSFEYWSAKDYASNTTSFHLSLPPSLPPTHPPTGHLGTLQFICHSPTAPAFITCSVDSRVRFFYHRDQTWCYDVVCSFIICALWPHHHFSFSHSTAGYYYGHIVQYKTLSAC